MFNGYPAGWNLECLTQKFQQPGVGLPFYGGSSDSDFKSVIVKTDDFCAFGTGLYVYSQGEAVILELVPGGHFRQSEVRDFPAMQQESSGAVRR